MICNIKSSMHITFFPTHLAPDTRLYDIRALPQPTLLLTSLSLTRKACHINTVWNNMNSCIKSRMLTLPVTE